MKKDYMEAMMSKVKEDINQMSRDDILNEMEAYGLDVSEERRKENV